MSHKVVNTLAIWVKPRDSSAVSSPISAPRCIKDMHIKANEVVLCIKEAKVICQKVSEFIQK